MCAFLFFLFLYFLVRVTCCPFGGANVGRLMPWYAGRSDFGRKCRPPKVEQLRLVRQVLRQEEELQPERKEMERNVPISQSQVKEALIRDLLH